MHAPPSFQLTVRHYGVWHWACGVLVGAALLPTVVWSQGALAACPGWLSLSVLIGLAAALGVLLLSWRLAPTSLRWDGQVWHLGPEVTVGQEPGSGGLAVALDLGSWMLLHFKPEGARRGRWLPVQRRGHALSWHALRATVYCARPISQSSIAQF
jgi:hypothetical protein